jgi:phage FluMu protein Com
MQPVLVKNIHCFCCDTPTPLLTSSLEGKLGYRSTSSTYGIEIFFACPHCKTVGQSSIPVQSERRTIVEGQQSPADTVPFCVLLECAQAGCEFRISILGAAKRGTMHSQVQNLCRTWKFGREVQCEGMHRPAQPPQIAGVIFGD